MEPYLRGNVESLLDDVLEKQLILVQNTLQELFSPLVQSMEDMMCGYVVGRTVQFAFDAILALQRRNPTDEEFLDIAKMLRRRALEIKEQVRKVLSR